MATRTFTATTNNLWSNTSNWDGGSSTPSNGDDIVIGAGATTGILLDFVDNAFVSNSFQVTSDFEGHFDQNGKTIWATGGNIEFNANDEESNTLTLDGVIRLSGNRTLTIRSSWDTVNSSSLGFITDGICSLVNQEPNLYEFDYIELKSASLEFTQYYGNSPSYDHNVVVNRLIGVSGSTFTFPTQLGDSIIISDLSGQQADDLDGVTLEGSGGDVKIIAPSGLSVNGVTFQNCDASDGEPIEALVSNGNYDDGGNTNIIFRYINKLKLRNIQKGWETMSGGTATVTTTIKPIDMSKSILLVRHIGTTEDSGKTFVSAELASNQIVFTRADSATDTVYVEWQLVEFVGGLYVQHGYSSGNTAATTNITINQVDLTKAFPIFNLSNTGSGWDINETFTATITTDTNLQIDRVGTITTYAIGWQVVEFDESVLIKANGSSNNYISGTCDADNQTDITLERSVNRSKCLIFGSYQASSSIDGRDMLSPSFTDSRTLSLIRQNGSITLDYVYYIVEVARGLKADHKTVEIDTGSTVDFVTNPVGINSNNVSQVNFLTLNNGLYGSYGRVNSADANPSYSTFWLIQRTPTKLEVTRNGSLTAAGDIDISTVTFDRVDSDDWSYSKFIEIDTTNQGANVSGEVTNFPLYVSLDNSNFNFSQAHPSGYDIRFLDRKGTFLDYEIDYYSSGNANFWVNIPEIRGLTKSYIKMLWGKSDINSIDSGSSVFNKSRGYTYVYHLDETSDSIVYDATDNNYSGQLTNVTANAATTSGLFGLGFEFSSTGHLALPLSGSSGETIFSISLWIKTSESRTHVNYWQQPCIIGTETVNANTDDIGITTNSGELRYWTGLGSESIYNTGEYINDNEWHLIYMTNDESTIKLYLDGTHLSGVDHSTGGDGLVSQSFKMAACNYRGSPSCYHSGVYDELRWESVARDSSWVKLCYENQKPDQTMVSLIEG